MIMELNVWDRKRQHNHYTKHIMRYDMRDSFILGSIWSVRSNRQ